MCIQMLLPKRHIHTDVTGYTYIFYSILFNYYLCLRCVCVWNSISVQPLGFSLMHESSLLMTLLSFSPE